MKLRFIGAAGTVTGSKTLVSSGKLEILVDCGLFQGLKALRKRNWEPMPVDARRLDAVVLTHAHLDHCGGLPLLVRQGYRGSIYCTAPTRALAELILMDSATLAEEDAAFANRRGFSRHHPALPLYTREDVARTLENFRVVPVRKELAIAPEVALSLFGNGHILGSVGAILDVRGRRAVFSGDLGRARPLLYDPPETVTAADALVVETTYGDRRHRAHDAEGLLPADRLARIVRETHALGGQILVPSFAVGRVQEILYLLSEMRRLGEIPDLPIYLDSPMGAKATRVFSDHPQWHRLERTDVDRMCRNVTHVETRAESVEIMREAKPCVIVAGSGMLTGGRILHHLAARLGDPRHTVVLVGYQAAGTRGRQLRAGADELRIHGRFFPVRCRVESIDGFSAHADQDELIGWLGGFRAPPGRVFLNHGEPPAADAFRVKLADALGWDCAIPVEGQEFDWGDV